MASSVFYRFKSQKSDSRVTFDGTGISVFDLKKEIILANNLGKANDFELALSDASSGHELKDDAHVIPRSSSVIARRLPAQRNGKGSAARYLAGVAPAAGATDGAKSGGPGGMTWHRGAMSKRFDGKEEPVASASKPNAPAVKSVVTNEDEAAAMAAMFQAQTASWEETQEKMSHATYIPRTARGGGPERGGRPPPGFQRHQPDRPLPPSYVCYRCGQKGHWIQDCPTNDNKEFDNRPRIKRTTGIPRSFLKTVENPNAGQIGQGVMVTPEGGFVVAQPDTASWQKQKVARTKLTEADVRERTPTDASLTCGIDKKLLKDAMKTPCCGTVYCEECITTHLLERDFVCPSCAKKIASLDRLTADSLARNKVEDYIRKAITSDEEQQAAASGPDALGGDIYAQQAPDGGVDMAQVIADSIPQLSAQLTQLAQMLQNPGLPPGVRQSTELQHAQLQLQLQQAQTIAAALAANQSFGAQQALALAQAQGGGWGGQQFNMQAAAAANQDAFDSPYQRLPVNNRRRNVKRERPSDFLEVGGSDGGAAKQARYWE